MISPRYPSTVQVCPHAYCEDHLPLDADLVGHCERFEALGMRHPEQVKLSRVRRERERERKFCLCRDKKPRAPHIS
jgi:hypothetical protein